MNTTRFSVLRFLLLALVAGYAYTQTAFAQGRNAAPMLLKGPANWGFERMPIPTGFAPDLSLKGFEEVRFAPGMFDTSSTNYFTYALAVSAEGTNSIGVAELKDFLDKYFRGLSISAGRRKGLNPDPAQFGAEVVSVNSDFAGVNRFTAKLPFFDTFNDGRKIALNLEIAVLPKVEANKTLVMMLTSPRATNAPVWQELRSIGKTMENDWSPKLAGDRVMQGLVNTTGPQVKGAHDSEFVIADGKAYIVAEANDVKPGEAADWPYVYVTLSIVDLKTMKLERVMKFAHGEAVFANEKLPVGACFVPRIIQKDAQTLRCYFASEEPKKRQSQMWYIDFDLKRGLFANTIHKVKIKTAAGTFDMQPQYLHEDAKAKGFTRAPVDFGLYIFDSFKAIDGKTYVTLNNYPGGQNALATVNQELDTFEVIGHFNEPAELKLTESAVHKLPDGTWLAICRQEGGNRNYTFATSADGAKWSANAHRDFVPNGTSSKPTLEKVKGVYYLGWQEATTINGVSRSVFNIDVSRDGKQWERKYRFETEKSFQYPAFHEYEGAIYLTVTQGDTDASRKERIMFGRLE
jgi:hypothetical protein